MIELIQNIIHTNPLFTYIIVAIASLLVIFKSSSLLIHGISSYSRKLGLSDYITGMVIVSIAASLPELLASFSGVTLDSPGVILGTIFGSNIIGITLIIGLAGIVGKRIKVKEKVFEKTKWRLLFFIALPFILLIDGKIGFIDGIILLISFFGYLILLWWHEGKFGSIKKNVKIKDIYKEGSLFIINLLIILFASRLLVESSLKIADILSLHPFVVSIVILGLGSQIPDLFVILHSVNKGHSSVGMGDLLGSMITKSLLFFGLIALFIDLTFGFSNTLFIGFVTVGVSALLFHFIRNKVMTRRDGIVLLIIYAAFLFIQFMVFA